MSKLLFERYLSFKALADQKRINLSLQVPEVPVFAEVDIDSMHKIFNNLFYNALVYGEKEAIVALRVDPIEKTFTIQFSNDGPLVPEEMKEKIFEPFVRLKETQHKPGNGIGLALSRALVLLHHGKLYFDGSRNNMNIFVMILPFAQSASKASIEG